MRFLNVSLTGSIAAIAAFGLAAPARAVEVEGTLTFPTGFVPAINYPESAILGMGRVAPKAVVRDGQVVIRTMLPLVLAFYHRISDGADAARFVNLVASWLTEPTRMLAEA